MQPFVTSESLRCRRHLHDSTLNKFVLAVSPCQLRSIHLSVSPAVSGVLGPVTADVKQRHTVWSKEPVLMGSCPFWFPAILANKYCSCCLAFRRTYNNTRLVFSSSKYDSVSPLLHRLRWLKAPERIQSNSLS